MQELLDWALAKVGASVHSVCAGDITRLCNKLLDLEDDHRARPAYILRSMLVLMSPLISPLNTPIRYTHFDANREDCYAASGRQSTEDGPSSQPTAAVHCC